MANRTSLGEHLNSLGLTGKGVEVGVFKGEFSNAILRTWKGKKLYLVDVWRNLDNYNDMSNQKTMFASLDCLMTTFQNIYPYGDRAVLLREESVLAAKMFDPKSLDFVYIDAAHDREAVLKDLKAWYPKVKKGGLLCGHDFLDMPADQPGNVFGEFGVRSAVMDFAKDHNLKVQTTSHDGFPSWFIQL